MSRWRSRLVTLCGCGVAALVLAAAYGALLPVRVVGGSMHPALHVGDLAFVKRGHGVSGGDIALLASPGRSRVLHRVISVDESGAVRTRGDANPIEDLMPADEADIQGRVISVVHVGAVLERWRGESCCATLTPQSDSARR